MRAPWARHPPSGWPIDLRGPEAKLWPGLAVQFTGSGTEALALAIERSGARKVWLPAYGCPNLLAAAQYARVEVDYYDINPQTFAAAKNLVDAARGDSSAVWVHVDAFGAVPLAPGAPENIIYDGAQSYAPFEEGWQPPARFNVVSFGRAKPVSLTMGGALLEPGRISEARRLNVIQQPFSLGWRPAAYNLTLKPEIFGVLARLPGLGIGEPRLVPVTAVKCLGSALALPLSRAVHACRSSREALVAATVAATRLVEMTDVQLLSQLGSIAAERPLWRMPVFAESASAAQRLASDGANLGVTRLYRKVLPQFAGVDSDTARTRWPGAWHIANHLLTLPTHGRLSSPKRRQLRRLLVG